MDELTCEYRVFEDGRLAEHEATQPCGHPATCVVSTWDLADEGTSYCGWCEAVARAERADERLARIEAVFWRAVDGLWGFWDGNTLRIAPSCDDEQVEMLHLAWDDLLAASVEPSQAANDLLERLRLLEQVGEAARLVDLQLTNAPLWPRGLEAMVGKLREALVALEERGA